MREGVKKTLGILGGMGSHASTWLLQRIVGLSKAQTDQDHLDIILHNNSKIPDRTSAIVYNEASPLPELVRSIELFNVAGVEVGVIACMTAHYYYNDLKALFRGHLLNAADIAAAELVEKYPNSAGRCVGVIGSTGMLRAGMFQNKLAQLGYEALTLTGEDQEKYFMEPLYGKTGIKAGFLSNSTKSQFLKQFDILGGRGAEVFIGACSEIPLVIDVQAQMPLINVFDLLAQKTVEFCYNN
jgi:aspartate racemase